MPAGLLIELEKGARLGGTRRDVERLLLIAEQLIDHSTSGIRKREIELSIFGSVPGRAEEKKLVSDNRTAARGP